MCTTNGNDDHDDRRYASLRSAVPLVNLTSTALQPNAPLTIVHSNQTEARQLRYHFGPFLTISSLISATALTVTAGRDSDRAAGDRGVLAEVGAGGDRVGGSRA